MRDLFEGNPNLANKRVTVPVTAIPADDLLPALISERESLFRRIKPKRAAVHWGIGRYLYRMDNVWAPCETFNGKWSKWIGSPWDHVGGAKRPTSPAPKKPKPEKTDEERRDWIKAAIAGATVSTKLDEWWKKDGIRCLVF